MLNKKQIYRSALKKWGAEEQIGQAIEECAELIVALRHFRRGKATLIDVATEIADVEIMTGQLRVLLGDRMIDAEKKRKLDQLGKRVEGGSPA